MQRERVGAFRQKAGRVEGEGDAGGDSLVVCSRLSVVCPYVLVVGPAITYAREEGGGGEGWRWVLKSRAACRH